METPVEPSERGRYAIFVNPDGSLAIPRSAPLCDRCASCGCGEPQTQIEIPSGAIPVLQAYMEGGTSAVIRMMAQNGTGFTKLPGMIKEARRK